MTLNTAQIGSGARTTLTAVGTLAVAFGWLAPAELPTLVDAIVGVVGSGVIVFNFFYGMWIKTHANTVAAAAQIVKDNPTMANVLPLAGALNDAGANVSLKGLRPPPEEFKP